MFLVLDYIVCLVWQKVLRVCLHMNLDAFDVCFGGWAVASIKKMADLRDPRRKAAEPRRPSSNTKDLQ